MSHVHTHDGAEGHECRTLTKQTPEEEQTEQEQAAAYGGALVVVHNGVLEWLTDKPPDGVLTSETLTRIRVNGVFSAHDEMLDGRIISMAEEGARAGRASAQRRFDLDVDPEDLREQTRAALREIGSQASAQTHARQSRDIARSISNAYADGQNVDEIASTLRRDVLPDARQWEAKRVAATEVHAGSERGKLGAYQQSGVERNTWLSAFLPTSRASHMGLSGTTKPIGSTFYLGGNACRYPGDPGLPAKDRVNCYCELIPS